MGLMDGAEVVVVGRLRGGGFGSGGKGSGGTGGVWVVGTCQFPVRRGCGVCGATLCWGMRHQGVSEGCDCRWGWGGLGGGGIGGGYG